MSEGEREAEKVEEAAGALEPRWGEKQAGLEVPGRGTNDWLPAEERPEDLPPGGLPYVTRDLQKAILGSPLASPQGLHATDLETSLRGLIASRAKVEKQIQYVETKMASLMVTSATLSQVRAQRGVDKDFMKWQTAYLGLLRARAEFDGKVLETRQAMGEDIGAKLSPEEELGQSRKVEAEGVRQAAVAAVGVDAEVVEGRVSFKRSVPNGQQHGNSGKRKTFREDYGTVNGVGEE